MKELAQLTNLRWLDLGDTRVTDAGVKELSKLRNLQFLNLPHNADVTDAGLMAIRELVNLERLSLSRTRITDKGLKELRT